MLRVLKSMQQRITSVLLNTLNQQQFACGRCQTPSDPPKTMPERRNSEKHWEEGHFSETVGAPVSAKWPTVSAQIFHNFYMLCKCDTELGGDKSTADAIKVAGRNLAYGNVSRWEKEGVVKTCKGILGEEYEQCQK